MRTSLWVYKIKGASLSAVLIYCGKRYKQYNDVMSFNSPFNNTLAHIGNK